MSTTEAGRRLLAEQVNETGPVFNPDDFTDRYDALQRAIAAIEDEARAQAGAELLMGERNAAIQKCILAAVRHEGLACCDPKTLEHVAQSLDALLASPDAAPEPPVTLARQQPHPPHPRSCSAQFAQDGTTGEAICDCGLASETTAAGLYQHDLGLILNALGLGAYARSESPHMVVHDVVLPRARELAEPPVPSTEELARLLDHHWLAIASPPSAGAVCSCGEWRWHAGRDLQVGEHFQPFSEHVAEMVRAALLRGREGAG